jgi:hypothetical protein
LLQPEEAHCDIMRREMERVKRWSERELGEDKVSAGAKWDRQWSQWRYRPQSNSQDTSPLLQQTRQAREKQVIVLYIYTVHILPWKTIHIYIYTYIHIVILVLHWIVRKCAFGLGSFDWVPSKATEHRTQARNQQKSKTRVYLVVQNRFLHEQHQRFW